MPCCWPYPSVERLAWGAVRDVEFKKRKGIQSFQIQSHIIVSIPDGVSCLTRLYLGPVSQFPLPEKAIGRHGVHESAAEILPPLPFHPSWEIRISQCAGRSCLRPSASLTKCTLKCNFQSCFFLQKFAKSSYILCCNFNCGNKTTGFRVLFFRKLPIWLSWEKRSVP